MIISIIFLTRPEFWPIHSLRCSRRPATGCAMRSRCGASWLTGSPRKRGLANGRQPRPPDWRRSCCTDENRRAGGHHVCTVARCRKADPGMHRPRKIVPAAHSAGPLDASRHARRPEGRRIHPIRQRELCMDARSIGPSSAIVVALSPIRPYLDSQYGRLGASGDDLSIKAPAAHPIC